MRGLNLPATSGCSGGGSKPIDWAQGNKNQHSISILGPMPGPDTFRRSVCFPEARVHPKQASICEDETCPLSLWQLPLSLLSSAVPLIRVGTERGWERSLPEAGCATSLELGEADFGGGKS